MCEGRREAIPGTAIHAECAARANQNISVFKCFGRRPALTSFFQVGGHVGSALGPLLATFFVLPRGRESLAWSSLVALLGMCILVGVGQWHKRAVRSPVTKPTLSVYHTNLPPSQVQRAMAVLIALIFSKFFYLASITSYYIFYLMHRLNLATETA